MHAKARGVWGMPPQENFEIRCSEIESEGNFQEFKLLHKLFNYCQFKELYYS